MSQEESSFIDNVFKALSSPNINTIAPFPKLTSHGHYLFQSGMGLFRAGYSNRQRAMLDYIALDSRLAAIRAILGEGFMDNQFMKFAQDKSNSEADLNGILSFATLLVRLALSRTPQNYMTIEEINMSVYLGLVLEFRDDVLVKAIIDSKFKFDRDIPKHILPVPYKTPYFIWKFIQSREPHNPL